MSIVHAVKAFESEFGWKIGDGMIARTSFSGIQDGRVRDLWRSNSCEWGGDRVKDLYSEGMSAHICALSIMGFGPHRLLWRTIWKLYVLLKIHIFAWKDATHLLDLKAFENLITVSWNIWNNGNNDLFHRKEEDARLIWEQARTLVDDFRNFSSSHVTINPRPLMSHIWVKRLIDVIKINVDATIHDTVVGIEIIAQDSDGFVLDGHVVYLDYKVDVQWAEAKALREGIVWARDNNVARAIFKTKKYRSIRVISIGTLELKIKHRVSEDSSIEFQIKHGGECSL
ncbi:hypothetical protein Goshw_018536, partial [Gossypium schwendimanii]|nr:hypothetical protein [Gossypium schwendimanii]